MRIMNNLKNEKTKLIVLVVSAILFFIVSYFGSYYYKLSKINKNNTADTSATVQVEDANKALTDDFIVRFLKINNQNVEEVYYQSNIGELKKTMKVESLSEAELEKTLTEGGFKKIKREEKAISFIKEDGKGLKANKYYIGAMDGKLAIYKTDENGSAYIEKAEDITETPINIFPEKDQNDIKDFLNVFDTREDCEEALTAYTS
ncbi:MAG: hypothetical protein ACRDD2_04485 [Sarcina sp.]